MNSTNNCTIQPINEKEIPFYSIISPSDQFQYQELRRRLSSNENRYIRNKKIESFQESIEDIKKFCIRSDEDDWKRFLICGICWIDDGICINTRRLQYLLGKSKSSINGSLQKMDYITIPAKGTDADPLLKVIPFLKNKFEEQRQWTIRKIPSKSQVESQNNNTIKPTCHHCKLRDNSNDSEKINDPPIRKPCAFGCTCGCDCKFNGEAEHPCTCIYPDDSYEYGKDVCHCEKIAGMAQMQPIVYDETLN